MSLTAIKSTWVIVVTFEHCSVLSKYLLPVFTQETEKVGKYIRKSPKKFTYVILLI